MVSKSWHLCLSCYKLFLERFSFIGMRRGKYHQGRGNTLCKEQLQSFNNLSSTLKFLTSYLHLYSTNLCMVYRNGLNQSTSKVRHFKYLKKYGPYYFETFCRESAFQYNRAPQKLGEVPIESHRCLNWTLVFICSRYFITICWFLFLLWSFFIISFGYKFILYGYSIMLGDYLLISRGFVMMVCSNFNLLCSNIIILCS